jgi:hypothetical protein
MNEPTDTRRRRLRLRLVVGVIALLYIALGVLFLTVWLLRDELG